MTKIETVNKIINNWKKKGDNEEDNFNKFICYWIAFNAWYSTHLNKQIRKPDFQTIKNFKVELKKHKVTFDEEIKVAQKLNPNLKNLKNNSEVKVNDLDTLVDFIYTVRNNLFHGNKRDEEARDEEIMKISVPILKKVLETVLKIENKSFIKYCFSD